MSLPVNLPSLAEDGPLAVSAAFVPRWSSATSNYFPSDLLAKWESILPVLQRGSGLDKNSCDHVCLYYMELLGNDAKYKELLADPCFSDLSVMKW